MSDFLKFAFEVLSAIVYNFAAVIASIVKLVFTGWIEYFMIFKTYFFTLNILAKGLSILLMLILIAIPLLMIVLVYKRIRLKRQLKNDNVENDLLYKEIGKLNKQVLDLMDEKNKILAMKVNKMGATEPLPYMGAAALLDADGAAVPAAGGVQTVKIATDEDQLDNLGVIRFPKLHEVDLRYASFVQPEFDNEITLEEFCDKYRRFAASQLKLYYVPETIRRFVASMAASKLMIIEGISGTGKTSLPYSFSRFLENPATMVSVQPSFRDRTELIGYFNEFSKRFNETEFLRALYEANYRDEPSYIVLDEMNLARIEYYFAEMLSILEMPSQDEWVLDLVPTGWPDDPKLLDGGKITISDKLWFVGTANNDDSTFTITDKVYDRAMPIELNERADFFECEPQGRIAVSADHLQYLFLKAKVEHPISEDSLDKMKMLDQYLQTRFKLMFGNRIMKQMHDYVPAYVACGGTEYGGMDYIIARKVLKKFESMSIGFVRDEIQGLIDYIEKLFGEGQMEDSINYLYSIQNFY